MTSQHIEINNLKTTRQLIDQVKTLEHFSSDKKQYYAIINTKESDIIYISKNITNHGFTQQEIYGFNSSRFEKHLFEDHSNIRFKFSTWKKKFLKFIKKPPNKFRFVICGLKIKNKWNKFNSFVIKGKKISVDDKSSSSLYFLEIEEISNLYTSDLYWAQLLTDTNSRVYFSSGTKKEATHLLTSTELKVVYLITKNHTSSEIATQLNVGLETIKKHRKNILAKTKVKDMTSLIQLLILCDMI